MLPRLCLFCLLTFCACGNDVTVADKPSDQPTHDASEGDAGDVALCGTVRCMTNPVTITGTKMHVIPCCYNEAASTCGIAVSPTTCFPANQAGHEDADCMGFPTSPIGPLPGCCRPDNTCGLYDAEIGFGCAQIPFLAGFASCKYTR